VIRRRISSLLVTGAVRSGSMNTFKEFFEENYADGKVKGKSRPGRVKKSGASCKGSVTELRKKAKKYGGEKGKMYHWCANMKGGKRKSESEEVPEEDAEDNEIAKKIGKGAAKLAGKAALGTAKLAGKAALEVAHFATDDVFRRKRKKVKDEDAEKKVSKTRAKCQAKAKRKYDVWPSAYASGYVQKCVNRGGNIK